jgi:hypothetical protein
LPEQQAAIKSEQEALLSLLRTKGLSIKYLENQKKAELRMFLDYLHNTKGLSQNDIAKLIGNKTSGYTSWLCRQLGIEARPFEEARLKGIREKRRKYERNPFDGTDEDKAYLLGLRHGDLSVSKPWNGVVRVSTSTTHPAMSDLFHSLFEPYGHVYQDPRFKRDTNSYEWNIYAIVDSSFDFLLQTFPEASGWILSKPSTILAYLGGLLDAEGTIGMYRAKLLTILNVAYYNTNLKLIWFVFNAMRTLGLHPQEPYLDKKKGLRSPGYHIEMKKDYWRVVIGKFDECQIFLRMLPIRHPEKILKKALALSLVRGQSWKESGPKVESLRSSIKGSRNAFVAEAEKVFLANPKHHSTRLLRDSAEPVRGF